MRSFFESFKGISFQSYITLIDNFLSFTALGLFYDVFGVIFLGYAFFIKSKKALLQEAENYFGYNPHLLKEIISSKFDGIFGSVLLFIGFLLQMCGVYKINDRIICVILYLVLLGILFIYFKIARKKIVEKWEVDIKEMFKEKKERGE